MKILLFGKNGQLGWELNRSIICFGELIALDYPEVNFEKPAKVLKVMNDIKPDLIINAAAYTDVDRAELENDKARMINAETPSEIARWCKINSSLIIHYSTDYVFDGSKGAPYTEDDIASPINYYGRTKLEGDQAIQNSGASYIILRTAWLYSMRGNNFVNKILELAKKNRELRIVDDQIGNPTWARMLAEATANIIAMGLSDIREFFANKSGIYHCASLGFCSRYDWASLIIKLCLDQAESSNITIKRAKSRDYKSIASRPLFSVLNCEKIMKIFNIRLPSWKTVFELAVLQLK